jgi:hypothetical protein
MTANSLDRAPAPTYTPSANPAASGTPALPGIPPGTGKGRGHLDRFGETDRTDAWWVQPLAQALGLLGLIGYANWAAFQGNHYLYEGNGADYLSPFYSPTLKPAWWPLSPAFLILIFPLGFRTTCYYYRKAYYRAFFSDPAACAVGERTSKGYCGEAKFPFILQNIHRYFLYAALVILVILWWDVIKSARFHVDGGFRFGIGGGTLAILASTGLLTLYTFSCHSLRHIIGGRLDCFSCAAGGGPQQKAWGIVSLLNARHMAWAWWSLFAVCFADFYVRMCSMGIIKDIVFFPFDLFSNAGSTGL